jgi:signal transduction histidine kinase
MSPQRLVLRSLLLAAVTGAAALGAHVERHGIRHDVEAAYRRDLRHLDALGAELDRELLRSRAGLVMHYDALTRGFQELRRTTRQTASPPSELGFEPGPELYAALHRLEALLRDEALLLDHFKSDNAILRNSRQYYPVLLDELRDRLARVPGTEPVRERLAAILSALAHLDAAPANDAVALLSVALDELSRAGPGSSLGAGEVELVLKHGRLIVDHHASVDQLVARVLALPVAAEIARATHGYEQSYGAALRRGQLQISLLTGLIAAAVVLGLFEVIARVRADARALRQAKAELERANLALDRERQREHQLNELKTRFVSATSHEFRTPLTTILSSSQMLASYGERWDAERRMTHFDRISTAAHHMTEMLEEILLIGRAEMGVLAPSPVALDLHDFSRSLVETLSRAAGRQGSVELDFSGERSVSLDRRLLTHVFGNLVENALKYSEAPSLVSLRVSVGGAGVNCIVTDRGVGIPESDLPRLFDSFYRGQNVGSIAGSGLGLAVVKRAVDVQGGTIEVQSECGRGTTVTVWLPLGPSASSSDRRGDSNPNGGAVAEPRPAAELAPSSRVRSAVRNA